jgi:hypothetical protein
MIIGHKKLKDDSNATKTLDFQNHEQQNPHVTVSISEKRFTNKKFKKYRSSQLSFRDEETGLTVKYYFCTISRF